MTTVLVTGSEGNIGRYIVAALHRNHPDWKVLRLGRAAAPAVRSSNEAAYTGDLCEPATIERILADGPIDCVIHAASPSYSHAGYRASPLSILESDCRMSLNVLRHGSRFGKIVYLSSALVYERADVQDLAEDITDRIPAPVSSYGVAKYLGEQAVRHAHGQFGTPFTIWRPFNVVSPLEPTQGEGRHVFVDFYRRLFIDRVAEFQVLGSGNQVRCFIWVEEAADCLVRALGQPSTDNEVINLARQEPLRLLELKDLLLRIGRESGALPPDYDPPVKSTGAFAGVESEARIPSVAKLRALTGWASGIDVEACFRRFVADKQRAHASALIAGA